MISLGDIDSLPTPFYYYDRELLERTLGAVIAEVCNEYNYHVHYAVKANANTEVLQLIAAHGLGADCVSGWEVQAALDAGFAADAIVFAGVGKTDAEIRLALYAGIGMFNVESQPELEVISQLATEMGTTARVALRINPNVGAHTHSNITTGLSENKFGIDMVDMLSVIEQAERLSGVNVVGLHFHIGSQITDMHDFVDLCHRINELQDELDASGITYIKHINVGGGLGINYDDPEGQPMADFKSYFAVFRQHLKLREGQELHFELGRSIVAQMGTLITRVIYVKRNAIKQFAIVDAGFTDLIRPALYGAYHKIENLTSPDAHLERYDVVGPICESTDVFACGYDMPQCKRGELLAIRSVGAYGEVMSSGYNCRPLPKGILR